MRRSPINRKPPGPLTEAQRQKKLEEIRAWYNRQGEVARRSNRRAGRPRNDSQWRADCIETYGARCLACGDPNIEMHHIIYRSHCGPSVVENGIPLCGAWSSTVDGGHHAAAHAGKLKICPEWLTDAQRIFLAKYRWVDWDASGLPFGQGYKHFAPRKHYAPPGS